MSRIKHKRWLRITYGPHIIAISVVISSFFGHYLSCRNGSCCAADIETCFTPQEPCMDLIVSKILAAQQLILVQAYVLTSEKIAHALVQAHRRNVTVQLLIDKYALTVKGSKINWLFKQGVAVILDEALGLAHNKVIIIDDNYVITGSFNWTNGAQVKNAENVIIIKGSAVNSRYKKNWYSRVSAGVPLKSLRGYVA